MYRERIRSCPACLVPMNTIAVAPPGGPASVEVCDLCGGVFLDYHDGEPSLLARALRDSDIDVRTDAQPRDHHDPAPACPDCERDLALLAYLGDGPPLYRCSGCMAAFVTRDQLGQLATYEQLEPEQPSLWQALWKSLF